MLLAEEPACGSGCPRRRKGCCLGLARGAGGWVWGGWRLGLGRLAAGLGPWDWRLGLERLAETLIGWIARASRRVVARFGGCDRVFALRCVS